MCGYSALPQHSRGNLFCMLLLRLLLVISITSTAVTLRIEASAKGAEPYYLRGKQIEQRYKNYTENLQTAFVELKFIVSQGRQDLLSKLKKPERRQYGYQLIPKILPDPLATCAEQPINLQKQAYRPKTNRFSWTITDALIEKEASKLRDTLEPNLATLAAITDAEIRHETIKSIVETYRALRKQNRFLDEMIQHNWLWQKEISARKPKYDKSTLIHDVIVERTLLLDALATDNDDDYEETRAKISNVESIDRLRTDLPIRIEQLDQQILNSSKGITPRDYVRLEQPQAHRWIFKVPVNTDIVDENFLREFKSAVEARWCLDDGEDQYRVQMDLRRISAASLYNENGKVEGSNANHLPIKGQQINLISHCRNFPAEAAVLSSGAKKTYIRAGCLFVGPEDVKASTLVHEFGHLLGFADEYVRGYRDLGRDGYEILEIKPSNENIMANSSKGGLQSYHFSALTAGVYFRAGLAAASSGDHEAAIIAYQKTITVSSDSFNTANAYNNLGWSLKHLGQYQDSITALEAAARLRPEWHLPKNNLKLLRSILDK